MKKIGIVTIYDNNNYGNRLQNYALQQYLVSLGFCVQTIKNIPYIDFRYGNFRFKLLYLKRLILNLPFFRTITRRKEVAGWKSHLLQYNNCPQRYEAFSSFDEFISYYPNIIGYYNMKELNSQFDYFITGSDQVWNPLIGRGTGLDFLTFADKKKRIAYAASISLDSIPKKYHARFSRYLKGIKHISVREQQAVEIINNEFGLSAICVIDPTMLITRDEWEALAMKSIVYLPRRYVLCMFLGDKFKIDDIKEYASNNNCEIIWLNDKDNYDTYSFGPIDFLYAILHAQMIFTDSFHGCVFSIIFHTSFFAVNRKGKGKNMYSRIQGLLELFGLEDRQYVEGMSNDYKEIEDSKWNMIDQVMESEREKGAAFLSQAMKENQE